MAVIVGQSRADVMRPFLDAWAQRNQNQPLIDAQTAHANALTQEIATKGADEAAKAKIADFEQKTANVKASGDVNAYNALRDQFVKSNPDVAKFLSTVAAPSTPLDQAAGNVANWKANQTGIAATGGNSPMANTVTAKLGTGEYLPNQAFTYQGATNLDQPKGTPAQPGPEAAGMIQRESGAATTAAQDQTAQTTKDVAAMNIAANKPLRDAQVAEANARTRQADAETKISTAKQAMLTGDKAGATNAFAEGVIANPQSYYGLTPEEKMYAAAGLGGKVPKKLTDYETRRLDAAENGMTILQSVKDMADKWEKRGIPITGPVIGRYNQAQAKWGDQIMPNVPEQYRQEYLADVSAIQENLTANALQEAASVVGGRPAYQVIEMLYNTGPAMSKGGAMLSGAIGNMMTRYKTAYDQIDRKQWGGKPPAPRTDTTSQVPSGQPQSNDPLGILQ